VASSSQSSRYWVRQQHEEITVVQQAEAPEGGFVRGERGVRVFGPFATMEAAQAFRDKEYARTLTGYFERARSS
jgi:hypothetical protein